MQNSYKNLFLIFYNFYIAPPTYQTPNPNRFTFGCYSKFIIKIYNYDFIYYLLQLTLNWY